MTEITEKNPPGWKTSVRIFHSATILRQLGIAIGIPFGIVVILLLILNGPSVYVLYALFLIAALFFLCWVFLLVFYRGRYEVEFYLDRNGILCSTQAAQAARNRFLNRLTVAAGFLSMNPAVSGAAILAESRQKTVMKWNRVTRLRFFPRRHEIHLRAGWMERMVIFCTTENYGSVAEFVKEAVEGR